VWLLCAFTHLVTSRPLVVPHINLLLVMRHKIKTETVFALDVTCPLYNLRLIVIRSSDLGYHVNSVTLQRLAFPTVDQYLASITINLQG
jgi:hypothetical protein